MTSTPSELLLQTTVSLLYKHLFHSHISLEIDTVAAVVKRPIPIPVLPTLPVKVKRKKQETNKQELVFNSDEAEKRHNGKRRNKPDFLRYSDLLLQEELRKADDISEFAESMEEELSTELKKQRKSRKPKKPLTLENGEYLKPGKQRKFTTILGVQQQEFSTMRTVEIEAASELQTASGSHSLRSERAMLREVNRYVLVKGKAVTLRPAPGKTFEALRDLDAGCS